MAKLVEALNSLADTFRALDQDGRLSDGIRRLEKYERRYVRTGLRRVVKARRGGRKP